MFLPLMSNVIKLSIRALILEETLLKKGFFQAIFPKFLKVLGNREPLWRGFKGKTLFQKGFPLKLMTLPLMSLAIMFLGLIFMVFFASESRAELSVDCFECHQELKKKCDTGIVHQAVRQNNCAGCHNSHTARFDHLLISEGSTLCYNCHRKQEEKWQGLKLHEPIQQAGCLGCHDAHASPYRYQLKAEGKDLCFRCHSTKSFEMKYVHKPVREGKCQTCHASHASKENFLLVEPLSKLCLNCHEQKNLAQSHQGYDVRDSECTLCHNPHSSNSKDLTYGFSHQPYKERNCRGCHQGKKEMQRSLVAHGANLCYTCHQREKEQFQHASRSHVADGDNQCTYCHNPHASERKSLTRKDIKVLCLSCHPKMAARLKENAGDYLHPEVAKGNCTSCHDPHSSSLPHFYKADVLLLCTKCHIKQKKARHPVGEKAIDPRDRKSQINCITCHDPMGTKFKYSLRWDGSQALCEQCHKKE
jgi:predicted CXXCH cytochrome family protein